VFGFDADMVFRIPALLIALTIHEYAHARVAVALGDPTPRFMGRLTLNPIAHLDPIGLIMLWLFRFGWAKPVPVNPSYFKDSRRGMIYVSLAGPGSNLVIAFLAALFFAVLGKFNLLSSPISQILALTYSYNVFFAIFNLVPIPPLDGSKILISLLPGRQAYALQNLEQYGTFILMGLVYVGFIGAITYPVERAFHLVVTSIIMLIL
jgi:Zn-dependent protease